jgi:hypothetical protein
MELKLPFELVKNLIAGVDMIVFAPVWPARDEGDEVRVLPDHAPLSPIASVGVDPLLQIEILQVRKHRTSRSTPRL